MVKTKHEQGAETRERILDAAAELFDSRGFSNTSLDAIAKVANVTRGAVYWHFKNKYDVFDALHQQMHVNFVETALEDLAQDMSDPLGQFTEFAIRDLLEITTDEKVRRSYSIFMQKCDYSGEMSIFLEKHNASMSEGLDILSQYFERAKERGQLNKNADSRLLAKMTCCFYMGLVQEYLRNPIAWDLKKIARPLVEQFMRGIKAS